MATSAGPGGETPKAPRTVSPVLRSLRFRGDEVQFGRVLAAICEESLVACGFVRAVIAQCRHGSEEALERVAGVPDDVSCLDEHILHVRLGRRATHHRTEDVGRVDLDFGGSGGWRMLVELKLDSSFGADQLERYSTDAPIAAVVRNLGVVPNLSNNANWVGAATWESLVPTLRALPLSDSDLVVLC